MADWNLPEERPASFDEHGWRIKIHPAEVKGAWHKKREWTQIVLLIVFLVLPWIRIGGEQALLLDVSRRQFEIFGLSLRAHNAPLLIFVLAIAGFGLFFVTAIWGRVWCGWACPQTVFVEAVYRRIERWVEGTAGERRSLQAAPWSVKKFLKKSIKWLAFLAVSLVITHSFLAYFVGTDVLAEMVRRAPAENWTSFLFIVISTGIILFDFGWFREQFCMIACPYGRFQSVLMDDQSMIVGYDEKRGEPRRGQVKPGDKQGDCVNCFRCVQVCPTGIDIRRGVQMECIACTACVDACDDVMTKMKRPTGLIRYSTLQELQATPDQQSKFKPGLHFAPRTIAYLAVITAAAIALTYFVSTQKDVDIQVLRGKGVPYQEITFEGQKAYLNQFFVEATNTSNEERRITVAIEDAPQGIAMMTSQTEFILRPGKTERIGFFIRFAQDTSKKDMEIELRFTDAKDPSLKIEKEIHLVGPLSRH
ncbi:MAG: cytochrome c oxidase accessory protein CcoG [Bdellovibrionaceae bacterium]|nr:cytochrome c oxidase accessory protein CcoG [Pseudobdellovibrionaceae bacterium]